MTVYLFSVTLLSVTCCRDKDSNSFIVAAEFDASAKFFAACTDCKQLLVWDVEKEWKLHSSRFV